MQGSLRSRYDQLAMQREQFLTRARECAKYTIPTLVPPSGAGPHTRYYQPYQSLGARGVNNLAAKFLLTLLPPNAPFFRLAIDDFTLERLTQQEGMRAQIEEALNRIERAVMTKLETSQVRPTVLECLKQLVVAGNSLLYFPPEGGIRMFRLDRYVVKRSPSGKVLELLTHERMSALELPPELAAMAQGQPGGIDDNIDVFTRVVLNGDFWRVQQEVNGTIVVDEPNAYPADVTPWLPLRLVALDGEDYGRSYVEEYIGDLKALEGLSKAILQGSAAAAKVLFLLNPNSTLKAKDLANAESGDIKTGSVQDVGVVQMEKYADFRVAMEQIQRLTMSLSFAFLLNGAVQRQAERVTAEEVRLMAAELETALGGIYSSLSQEFQLPLVSYFMFQMEGAGELPALPRGVIRPAVTTGMEAIGRGNDMAKLSAFFQTVGALGPAAFEYLNISDAIKRAGTSLGLDMKGLVRAEEEVAAMREQAMQQAMIDKLGPAAINQIGGAVREQSKQ